jgi:hypothetical protein
MDPVLAITLREERFGELAPLVFPNGASLKSPVDE